MPVKYTPTKYASPWRPCLTQRRGGGGEGEWFLLDLCEICVGHKLLVDICLVYLFVVFKAKTKYNVLESPVIRYKETSK